MPKRKAVFLDRDGVLIVDRDYAYRPEQMELSAGAADLCRALKSAGFLLLVITNQSGVARGLFDLANIYACHLRIQDLLMRDAGVAIDAFYICPHLADGIIAPFARRCDCRKPGTAMITEAVREWDIDLQQSYLIGDRPADIDCALAAGVPGIQLVWEKHPQHAQAAAHITALKQALQHIKV